jgi:protein TonB
MDKLIKQTMIYPPAALKERVEGSVYLRYTIDHKGKVIETKVLSSLGHGCDEEASRLVKLFTFEIPKIPYKTKVTFHKNIRIHFRLPKAKPKAAKKSPIAPTAYNYTLAPAKKAQKKTPTKKDNKTSVKPKTINYTISW